MNNYSIKILGNLVWLVFGGIIIAIEYFIFSLVLMITVVGIPFSFQTLKLASFALFPFGRTSVVKSKATGLPVYRNEYILDIAWWYLDCPYSFCVWDYSWHYRHRYSFRHSAFQAGIPCIIPLWQSGRSLSVTNVILVFNRKFLEFTFSTSF